MEPALDEASLVPCPKMPPADRVRQLADILKALDSLGTPRVLRSVRDAADRDLAGGRGLRQWCFDKQTPRDAGRFVASRLNRAPYIDGRDGLFAVAEAGRAIQSSISGVPSLAGGHAALTDGVLVILTGSTWPRAKPVVVRLEVLTDDEEWIDEVTVDAVDCIDEVNSLAQPITRKIESALTSGAELVTHLPEMCPRLILGDRAAQQLSALTGSEPFYSQVLRHLRALDRAAESWTSGTSFAPTGVTFSVEAEATLNHGSFGPLREFPTPPGFAPGRWTLHTKLTGGNGARLYYKACEINTTLANGSSVRQMWIAVGYVGPHLPTARFH